MRNPVLRFLLTIFAPARVGGGRRVSAFLMFVVCAGPLSAQEYEMMNVTLGGSDAAFNDVNSSGQAVGWARNASGETRAFLADPDIGMVDLGTLGGNFSAALDINDDGYVVGNSKNASGHFHAFLWDPNTQTMKDLGDLGSSESRATGISENGMYVSGYARVGSDHHAFLYDVATDTMIDIGTLGGFSIADVFASSTFDSRSPVNDQGQVTGRSYTSLAVIHGFFYEPVTDTMTDLSLDSNRASFSFGLNENGQVAGDAVVGFYHHAFLYDSATDTLTDLGTLGGPTAQVVGLNEAGQVAGHSRTSAGYTHAFLYDPATGVMQDLGTLGGNYSFAEDLNEFGQVTGRSLTASGYHPFLFDTAEGMIDLGTLGGSSAFATSLNNSGEVVGYSRRASLPGHAAFLHDGTSMHEINALISNAPAGTSVFYAWQIADDGTILANSTSGPVLLSPVQSGPAPTAPVLGPITPDTDPIPVGQSFQASADFTDENTLETHTGVWDWGDGSTPTAGTVSEADGAGTVTGTHTYSAAGLYTISLTVEDSAGLSSTVSHEVAVYDPTAGFVTGHGRIISPAGAYKADMSLSGPAKFGFISKYKKGANVPSGKTEFHFKSAGLSFFSDSYDWLVVAGETAKFKGVGSIEEMSGSYQFMLNARDGDVLGTKKQDRFRIKIWYYDTTLEEDVIVYDNLVDASLEGTADEGTLLQAGNIKVVDLK